MKDFGRWMADFNNSIEDESEVKKEESEALASPGNTRTNYQIRADFADLVLGKKPTTEDEVVAWVHAFAVEIDEDLDVYTGSITHVLGDVVADDYRQQSGDDENVEWWEDFYGKLRTGKLKEPPVASLDTSGVGSRSTGIPVIPPSLPPAAQQYWTCIGAGGGGGLRSSTTPDDEGEE